MPNNKELPTSDRDLKEQNSGAEHGWYGLPYSKAMFSTNNLVLGPNIKIKGDLSSTDILLLQSFSNYLGKL